MRLRTFILPLMLVASGVGSMPLPPVSAQDTQADTQRTLPPEAVELAEKYAEERAEAAREHEKKEFKQRRKRWADMARDAYDRFDSADERLASVEDHIAAAGREDPEIPRITAEMRGRIDRAERWVGQWADLEELPKEIGESFINMATGKFGFQIKMGNDKPPTQPSGEFLPPSGEFMPPSGVSTSEDNSGWLTAALNSDGAAGAGGSAFVFLFLWYIKRMRDQDKEEGDKRNDKVSEEAAFRAFMKAHAAAQQQSASGGGGGGGGR